MKVETGSGGRRRCCWAVEDRELSGPLDDYQEFREPVDHHAADQNVEEVNERAPTLA